MINFLKNNFRRKDPGQSGMTGWCIAALLFTVHCSLLTEVHAQALDPSYPFDVRLETYGCEDQYDFVLPEKEQCKQKQFESYMGAQWRAAHQIYYENLEEFYQDNNFTPDKIIDELYALQDQPVIDTRPKASGTPAQTRLAPINRFFQCTQLVCEAWAETCPQHYETSEDAEGDKGGITFSKVENINDWCQRRSRKLQRYSQVKTDLLLQERIARRALATQEEGWHRSVQLFLGGILPRTFKVLREVIDLDRKLDIYVRHPLQK